MLIASVMPSSHLILWRPLLLLPSIFPSGTFPMSHLLASDDQNTGAKGFSISPSSEHSRFISLKTDWFDLLAVQGTPRSLLQLHSWRHQFFSSLPSLWSSSHNHIWPLGKTIALTVCTFVSWVTSLLFNTLSRFVIAFLPRSKHLLISRLQSPSAVIWELKRRKSVTTFTFSPYICYEVVRPEPWS